MTQYLAFLRGVNVGGKNFVSMSKLREVLIADGFLDVSTYIQSGNVLFSSTETNTAALARQLEHSIKKHFGFHVDVVVYSKDSWQQVIESAPRWWGKSSEWKHNILILLNKSDITEAIDSIGELKDGIEKIDAGDGVLYQGMSKKLFGKTTTGKLASKPIYKRITVRNYNTATKLLEKMQ